MLLFLSGFGFMFHLHSLQGFGRVGGSAPPNTGYDSSLGSHVPHGQNVGTASGQVALINSHIEQKLTGLTLAAGA